MTTQSGPERATVAQPTGAEPTVERSVPELIGRLTSDVSTLFREEVELAKAEVRIEAKKAGKAAGKLGAAAVVGLIAALLLSWALAYLLALVLPTWLGFAIVGLIYAIVAAVLAKGGQKQLNTVDPTPHQTVETLQEDKQWLKNR